jgi:hypothetical protein
MAKIEDRHRTFVVDDRPVVTGLAPIADSWACTNPSVGRGASIGLMHAVALRDLIRDQGLDDQLAFASGWHDATQETVEPFYRDTLDLDRHRLGEIEAQIQGVPYETDDPGWAIGQALQAAAGSDPEVLRGFLDIVSLLARLTRCCTDRACSTRCWPRPRPRPSRCPARAGPSWSSSSARPDPPV